MKRDTTEQLILKHEGLVYYTLDMLHCKYTDEAISVGYEALWRAIETFDKTRNVKFSTYAVICIRNAIWDMYRAQKEVREHEISLESLPYELGRRDAALEPPEPPKEYIQVQNAVNNVLIKLSKKKRKIVIIWLGSTLNISAIAKEAQCSQSYASQVVKQAKFLLKKELINAGYGQKSVGNSGNI